MYDPQNILWPTPYPQWGPPTVPEICPEDPDAYAIQQSEYNESEYVEWDLESDNADPRRPKTKTPQQILPLIASIHSSAVQPQLESPLFRLPLEIRYAIWALVTATHRDPDRPYDRRGHLWRPDNTGPYRVHTQLLRTCRAVYSEAWDLPLKQTTLVIFEGSECDRPKWKWWYQNKPGIALFHLQSWQLLLLQRIEMTFQQIRLDGGGVGDWIQKFAKARSLATENMAQLAQEKETSVRQDIIDSILARPVCDITVKLNPRDWWTWTDEPPVLSEEPGAAVRAEKPGLCLSVLIPPAWTELAGLFRNDFVFTLVLQTFGAKRAQLERVVNLAKEWRFQAPLGTDGGSRREMVWDGLVRDEGWERELPETLAWMRKEPWKEGSKKVEVMKVRYVLRDVSK